MQSPTLRLDIPVDLNTRDETDCPWTFFDEALIELTDDDVGRYFLVGAGVVRVVAMLLDITDEGIVHVWPVPGSVQSNAHLLKVPLPSS